MSRLNKIKEYVRQRKVLRLDVLMIFVFLVAFIGVRESKDWYSVLPESRIELVNPYLAQADSKGNTYVIDEERSRVVKINPEQKVEYVIKSNLKEADTFWYAEDLAFGSDGSVFLLDACWDETGSAVGRECILAYDEKGRYVDTVLDIVYENEWVDKHRLFALTFWENTLFYVESQQEGFSLFSLSLENGEIREEMFYPYENAFNLIQDYALDYQAKTVYAVDKRGRILKSSEGTVETLYDTALDPAYAGNATFYRLAVDDEQAIYITDIKGNLLFKYTQGQESPEVYMNQGQVLSITSAQQEDNSTILGIWLDWGINMKNTDTGEENGGYFFDKSMNYLLWESLYQVMIVLLAVSTLWLFLRIVSFVLQIKVSVVQKNGLLAAGTAAVVAIVIVSQLLDQFSSVYREELMSKLYVLAYTTSGMMDGDSLEKVQTSEDYMSEDYQQIMKAMELTLNRKDPSVQEMYGNILRYEGGQGYAIAYLDNSIGTYYPLDEAETEELEYIYNSGDSVRNDGKDDVTGSYIYVRVPVMTDTGEVAAVIEIGTTSEVITSKVDDMRQSVMLTLILVILIVLFLFGEILSFFSLKDRYQKAKEKKRGVPLHLLRCSIFITYIAFNIASSFLPVYAAGFVTDAIGLPRELAASLPITLNLAFIGLTSLFCAKLLRRFSFRSVAAVSGLISMSGDLLLYTGQSYSALVIGLILNGIGMGLISNSINVFIAGSEDEEVKQEGFSLYNAGSLSGINCGMMLGASLAGTLGQRTVFACSATAWLLVAVLFLIMGKHMAGMRKEAVQENVQKKGAKAFWASKGVAPYMLFIQIPYVIINSFVFYYVPIYGADNGYSENIVCLFLMLNSLCSVYLSVAVTNYMTEHFKEKSIYLSSLLSFVALLLFGWNSTVSMLIVVLLLLGVAGSFGNSVRQIYFTQLEGVEEYGEDSAMGIYNFMDNIGESAGPMLFGSLLSGPSILPGLAGFVTVSGVMNVAYALLFRKKKKK